MIKIACNWLGLGMTGFSARGASSPVFNVSSRPQPLWRRYGAATAVALVGAAIGAHALAPPRAKPEETRFAAPARTAPSFVEADLPPLFAFSSEVLEKSARHRAYLAGADGGRLDIATIGDPAAEGALVRLVAATGAADRPGLSLFVLAAKQAAELDSSILRMEAPRTWSGGRDRVEWAPMTLLTPRDSRDCIAMRVLGWQAVELSGIVCPNAAGAADESTLSCVLDRVVATPRGIEAGLPEIVSGRPSAAPPCRGLSG